MTVISDTEIGDLLRATLTDMFGVKVWWNTPGVYNIEAGGKKAVVTRDEIVAQVNSSKGFLDLLKGKLDL